MPRKATKKKTTKRKGATPTNPSLYARKRASIKLVVESLLKVKANVSIQSVCHGQKLVQ